MRNALPNRSKPHRKPTSDAVEILHRRHIEGRPKMIALMEKVRQEDEIARMIYCLREQAELSQKQLARRMGLTLTTIRRLEDADYEGNSLAMLRKIAAALGKRIELRIADAPTARSA